MHEWYISRKIRISLVWLLITVPSFIKIWDGGFQNHFFGWFTEICLQTRSPELSPLNFSFWSCLVQEVCPQSPLYYDNIESINYTKDSEFDKIGLLLYLYRGLTAAKSEIFNFPSVNKIQWINLKILNLENSTKLCLFS